MNIKNSLTSSLLIVLFLIIFSNTLHADSKSDYPKNNKRNYNFQLALQNTTSFNFGFIQDRDDFLWIASFGGVAKYDGNKIRLFTQANSSLSNNTVSNIYEDRDGAIWITSMNGLNRYDKNKGDFEHFLHDPNNHKSLSSNVFVWTTQTLLDHLKPGLLWVGTELGVNLMNKQNGECQRFLHDKENPASLSHNSVTAILYNKDNTLWICTRKGLNRFNPEKNNFTRFFSSTNNNSKIFSILSINNHKNGDLLLGTEKNGLILFNTKNYSYKQYNSQNSRSLISDHIVNITKTPENNYWLAHGFIHKGMTLFKIKNNTFSNYTLNPSEDKKVSGTMILNTLYDNSNTLWVQEQNSLFKYDKYSKKMKLYSKINNNPRGLLSSVINVISEDKDKKLWIASGASGLYSYNYKKDYFTKFKDTTTNNRKFKINAAHTLFEDSSGYLWVGDVGGKILKLNKKKNKVLKIYYIDAGYAHQIIEDISDKNILWIAAFQGGVIKLNKQTGKTIKQYLPVNTKALKNKSVWSIQQDLDGKLYIPNGGLNVLNPKTGSWETYRHDPKDNTTIGDKATVINYIAKNRILWITSTGGGLIKFNPKSKKFTNYNIKNKNFPVNLVYSISEDHSGNLWLGTPKGEIIKFNPETSNYKLFSKQDGAQPGTFLPLSNIVSSKGEVWIGGVYGVNRFHPDTIKFNKKIPPVYFTSLTQGGEKINIQKSPERIKEITLHWPRNFFEFEFIALNYTNSEKNQYRYRLDGIDNEWYFSGTNKSGRYSNLPGGSYTLQIQGSNNDGFWNYKGAKIEVIIIPPWWKSWWFYFLAIIFIIITAIIIYNWRIKFFTKQNEKLEKKVSTRTKQLKLEKERAEHLKEKAETANKAKTEFLANMSHEIRTPLNSILGFSEILKDKLTSKKLSKYTDSIYLSGKSLLKLLNDILDLSKIEAGKFNLEYSAVSIKELFMEVKTIFNDKISEKGLDFIIDIPKDFPDLLILDETRLRQVFLNLVGNAIKFTPKGYIKLSASNSYTNKKNRSILNCIFSIEDSGKGIPENQKKTIFEAFTQVKGQKYSQHGGTGLGLSISKRLLTIMNGSIELKRTSEKGTIFQIVLNNIETAALTKTNGIIHDTFNYKNINFKNSTILIADDIEYNREVLIGFLEPFKFKILEAETGIQSLNILKKNKVNLILLDMKMPDMDGFQLVQKLRKDKKLKNIKIIAITASVILNDEKKIKQCCDSYLRKPVSRLELLKEIMNYIEYDEYSIKSKKNTGSLEKKALRKDKKLLNILLQKKEKCNLLITYMSIDEIAKFEQEIEKHALKHQNTSLQHWCKDLNTAIHVLDVKNIKILLNDFLNAIST